MSKEISEGCLTLLCFALNTLSRTTPIGMDDFAKWIESEMCISENT